MTLYRASFLHTPRSPFQHGEAALEGQQDGGLLVRGGRIQASGTFSELRALHPDEPLSDVRGGLLLPGFVDTHVHYPQVRLIGGLGLALLDWLDRLTLPEEAKYSDADYAAAVAREFVSGLVQNGTTSALVFGSHFAGAVDALFQEASRVGLRATAGLVVSDRLLRPELHTTPGRAYDEGRALIQRWHGRGNNRYAVTPRFSLSASEGLLESCGALMGEFPDVRFTSHINENLREIETVRSLFPGSRDYLDSYERAGLVTARTVLAHSIHPQPRELESMAAHACTAAHCPCSNAALGSGLFPLAGHVAAGVRVSLGTDVGGGTGFSMLKEGLQAYFMQQLLGDRGLPLSAAHLLYLCTRAGAQALGLEAEIGDFGVGKAFDAVWMNPECGSVMDAVLTHSPSPERALASLFAGGTQREVRQVWIGGEGVYARPQVTP